MTALNQAFIRAYTRGVPGASVSRPNITADDTLPVPTPSAPQDTSREIAHAQEAPPSPHFAPPTLSETLETPETQPVLESPPPSETPEPTQVTLPLIDFRPAWEVDAFEWPRPCDDLLASAGEAMAATVERLRAVEPQGRDVLVVTSLLRHEGRSTVAICLARAAAAAGLRVALVDADLEQAHLGELLGFAADSGWLTVLRQRQPLAEAAVASLADHLTLFPLSTDCLRVSDSGTTDLLRQALRALAASFDLVVVDAGPFQTSRTWDLEAADVAQDALAVVVRDIRITSHKQATDAARQLRQFGYRASGIIENFASAKEE